MKYLVRDKQGRDLACLLFGAAAWRAGARDQFVGWDQTQRAAALHYLANNTRYLILPWVKVAGLASHLLSQAARRLQRDWQNKYGHPLHLLESFVESKGDLAELVIARPIGSASARPGGKAGRGPTR